MLRSSNLNIKLTRSNNGLQRKYKRDGSLEKLKERCCARGDFETHNDLYDNWSICVSQRTVRDFIIPQIQGVAARNLFDEKFLCVIGHG